MTQLGGTELMEIFQEALKKDEDFMNQFLQVILQKLLEMERDQQIGVDKHARNGRRQGMRNGYKNRSLNTRLGQLSLRKPQIREFPFITNIFENYQRSEKALLLAIQQMVIDGVSTNKVKKDHEAACE